MDYVAFDRTLEQIREMREQMGRNSTVIPRMPGDRVDQLVALIAELGRIADASR